mgnify:CR=1 FL=1|tara:strand:+ start:111 stop:341 length:231 start_codon:yes stop_codon:yes gene_type:complete
MIEIIIQIIGFACLGYLAVEFISGFNLPELPDKPFRCELCLTYWISIIPLMVQFGFIGILYAAISSVIANIIFKYV